MNQQSEQKKEWYYSIGMAMYGPVEIDRVRALPPTTKVWHPDIGDEWITASEVPALAGVQERPHPISSQPIPVSTPVRPVDETATAASAELVAAVGGQLDRMARKEKHPVRSIVMLLLSLAAFAAIALFGWITPTTLAAILVVLLTHEMGHLLGFDHEASWSVMDADLDAGTRILPQESATAEAPGKAVSMAARETLVFDEGQGVFRDLLRGTLGNLTDGRAGQRGATFASNLEREEDPFWMVEV